jgi:cystathionine gamma-lyase
MGLGTRLVHKASPADAATGAIVPPLHLASTFVQESLGKTKGFEYARTGNPTRQAFESAMADIEGGARGLAFASGMAATTTLTSLLSKGDHVVAGEVVYGGTRRLFDKVYSRLGLEFTYVDARDPANIEAAMQPNTRLVFMETPTNPVLTLVDLKAAARIAHRHKALIAVDNTFLSPYGQRPLELGCDVALHSATKYISGHSDVLAGALVTKSAALGDRIAFLQNAMGAVASPFDCWLALRGMKTLHVRMERTSRTALEVAKALERHAKVRHVNFPGLPSHPQHRLARRQQDVFGGMLSFELKGGLSSARRVLKALRVFSLAESLGSVESLASHPATMTHAGLSPRERTRLGITPGLIRLSVGIEDAEDLLGDLKKALAKA